MMDRKEAKIRLQILLTNRCSTCRYGDKKCTQDCEFEQAVNMAIEALSADAVQGVGRYENAMQKLRDMPRYLNGVKEKQITKISTNYTTEKPNDEVEQGNDVVDYISRADAIKCLPNGLCYNQNGCVEAIKNITSADRPSGEWVIVNKGLDIYICDQCGEVEQIQRIPIWDYCPNCGAKMGGK